MDEKLEQLHRLLVARKLDNKSFAEFKANFYDNPEKQLALHKLLVFKKIDNKPFAEFQSNFFSPQKKNQPGSASQDGSLAQPVAPTAKDNFKPVSSAPDLQSAPDVKMSWETGKIEAVPPKPAPSPYQLAVTDATASRASQQVIGGQQNTPEEDQKISEKYGKQSKARFALEETRNRRNGDYTSDAIEIMERNLSDEDKRELAGKSLIEKGFDTEVTGRQYQAQLAALKKDQSSLSLGLDGIDLEITESIGDDAFTQYENNVARYKSLKEKYDLAAKSKDPTGANQYVDELNDLQGEIEKFQQHPLVQERNQIVRAMQKNLERFKSIEADDKYKGVREMESARSAIQESVNQQDFLSDFSGMLIRSAANLGAGFGRTIKNINEMTGSPAKTTPVSDFLIGISESADFLFPSPSQFSRGLVTNTAKWGNYEVDFKGEEIQAVRKGGKAIDMQLTEDQISEIKKLERSNQTNWSVAPYQAANVIVDMGIMLASADKISKGLTAMKVGEKAAARAGVALATAGQMSNSMYEQGLELFDGDKDKAAQFSFFGSLAVGAVQNVFGLEQRLLTGRTLNTKSLAASVGQMTPKQMGIEAAKILGKETVGEGFEEGLIEPLATAAASAIIGGKVDLDPTEMISNGAMGFMIGPLFAGGSVHMNEIQKSSLYNASKDPVAFGNALRAAIEKGDIKGDEAFVSEQVSRVTRIGQEISRLSPDLKEGQVLNAVELIDRRITAEARLKQAKGNEQLEQRYQAELDVLNGHLNEMMTPPTEEVAQKISENQKEEEGVSQESEPTATEPETPPAEPMEPATGPVTPPVTQAPPQVPSQYEPVTGPLEVGKTYYSPEHNRNLVYMGEKDGMMLFERVPNKGESILNPKPLDANPNSTLVKGLVQPVEQAPVTQAPLPELVKGNDSGQLVDNGYEFVKSIVPGGTGGAITLKQQQDMEAEGLDMERAVFYEQADGNTAVFLSPKTAETATPGVTTPVTPPSATTPPVVPPPTTPPTPTITQPQPTGETVNKTVTTERAREGAVRQKVKDYLEEKGWTRQREEMAVNSERADDIIKKFGEDAAVEAVKSDAIKGGVASAILFRVIKNIDNQIQSSKDPEEIDYLAQKQADLIELLHDEAKFAGQFTAQFAREYIESDIGWNKTAKTNEYVKKFGSISPEVEAKFAELDAQLKELNTKLAEAEKRAKEAADAALMETIKEEATKKKPTQKSISQAGKEIAKKIRAGKLARPGTFSAALPGLFVWDAAIEIAATAVEAGSTIAEAVSRGITHIKNSDWYKGLSDKKKADAEREFTDFLQSQDDTVGKLKVPKSLIRELVAGGIDNVPDLVSAVRKEMGLTKESDREIRDAITDYGKTINMTKDDISAEIRRLRRVGRIISALEDVANKIRPLRSGLQRDKLTAEERALQKQLREEMKGLPIDEETAENEQRTALDAAKRRLENQIEDLEREIARQERVKKTAKSFEGDAELDALREKRDQVKKKHDEMFKDEAFKEAKRLEDTKKRTKKAIADLEKRLAERDFAKKERKPLVEDSELIQLRAEKLRIREEYDKEFYKAELANRKFWERRRDDMWEAWGMTRVLMATGEFSFMLIQGGILTIDNPKKAYEAIKTAIKVMTSEKKSDEFIRNLKSQEWYPLAKQSGLKLTEAHASIKASEEMFYNQWSDILWNLPFVLAGGRGKKALETWAKLNPLRVVERAAVGYLDTLRAEKWLQMVDDGPLKGKSFSENKKEFKDVADAINTLSGRASLGPLETIAPVLTKLIFSPRNWASQIKMFSPLYAPIYFSRMSPTARKMALMSMAKFAAFNTALVMMAAARFNNDDDDETGVEFDPRSSDFMKVKLGDIRVDPWGGKIQHVIFAARMIMDSVHHMKPEWSAGGTKNAKGQVMPLGVRNKSSKASELVIQQITNKLSPSARIIYNKLSAEVTKDGLQDGFGNEYSMWEDVKDSLMPIFWQTVRELHDDGGIDAMDSFLLFTAFMGYGISKYGEKTKAIEKAKKDKDKPKVNWSN